CPAAGRRLVPDAPAAGGRFHRGQEGRGRRGPGVVGRPGGGGVPPHTPRRGLRGTAKRGGREERPPRRGRRVGDTVQAYVNSVARLSESLRARPDGGRVPAALGRGDVENFLNRLA